MKRPLWVRRIWAKIEFARTLTVVEGDTLPKELPSKRLVLAREAGEDWSVGFHCPCGCGRRVELLLVEEAKPRWRMEVNKKGRPTLTPSVWLRGGCGSHFFVRNGRITWCG